MGWQGIVSACVFLGMILLIALDAINLTLASVLGATLLLAVGIVSLADAARIVAEAHATIALFIGGMIIVRAFMPTGIFQYLGTLVFRAAGGSGKRLLLSIVIVTAPICAFLPNATTVILLGPLMVQVAELLEIDFVPLLILLVFVANSAGLLTLVGDPASFVVADSIRLGFVPFLQMVTPGAVLAIAGLLGLMPFLFGSIWRVESTVAADVPLPEIKDPGVVVTGGLIMLLEVVLFVIGERLPAPLYPAAVALIGSAIALAVVHQSGLDSVHNILRDVDWDTIVFFICVFVIVGAMDRTHVMTDMARLITAAIGNNLTVAVLATVFLIGGFSTIVPNIPLVVAMVPVVKVSWFNPEWRHT